MFGYDYVDPEFAAYLNRYCTGIILFKDSLQKVSLSYSLSDAYGNHACRFHLAVEFYNYEGFSQEDKIAINKYFYNKSDTTGSAFVSFIYQHQIDYDVNAEIVKSFIFHYQFAQSLFEGFIKSLLPKTCTFEIASLEEEPFFNYIRAFFTKLKYDEEDKSFEKKYLKITNRRFDFDCYYHKALINSAESSLNYNNVEAIITDYELFKAGGCGIEDIRKFVVENKVRFYIGSYKEVISEIEIDINALKEKIKDYISESSYSIRPEIILQLINKKEQQLLHKSSIIKKKSKELGVAVGDYVYVQKNEYGKDYNEIGLVKEISLNYNEELSIKYCKLNKDFTESRLSLKEAKESDFSFMLNAEVFINEINQNSIKSQQQLVNLLVKKGRKNAMYKRKKSKSK